ncbi:MAG TPA: hypothetical protein PLW65_31325 [Pseudomonadota bacterium]|nr:hypothetical protein [Pseudomonadota bacterium]
MTPQALVAVALHGVLSGLPGPGPESASLRSDRASEVQPPRPRGSLEDGMPPEIAVGVVSLPATSSIVMYMMILSFSIESSSAARTPSCYAATRMLTSSSR